MRCEGAFNLGDGGHCADVPMVRSLSNAAQVCALVEENHLAQIAHLFGDPEADIGASGCSAVIFLANE